MAAHKLSPYDPDLLDAIRQARADLYAAQAERRRVMLAHNRFEPARERAASKVQQARQDLDAARTLARETVGTPKEP